MLRTLVFLLSFRLFSSPSNDPQSYINSNILSTISTKYPMLRSLAIEGAVTGDEGVKAFTNCKLERLEGLALCDNKFSKESEASRFLFPSNYG